MIDREKNVQASLDHAEEVNRNAEEQKLLYEAKMAGAEAESRQLLKAARDEAKVQAKEIIDVYKRQELANAKCVQLRKQRNL